MLSGLFGEKPSINAASLSYGKRNEAKVNKKRRGCDETRFSTIQPSIDVTGMRNERWQ